jgi:hypothetical protein
MNFITKIRPQVLVAMLVLGVIAYISLTLGATEICAGCVSLVGALGMRILEGDSG